VRDKPGLRAIIFVTVSGWKNGRLVQKIYANKVYSAVVAGRMMSAIQITTDRASAQCLTC